MGLVSICEIKKMSVLLTDGKNYTNIRTEAAKANQKQAWTL